MTVIITVYIVNSTKETIIYLKWHYLLLSTSLLPVRYFFKIQIAWLFPLFQTVIFELFKLLIKKTNVNYFKKQGNNQAIITIKKKRCGLSTLVYILNCTKEIIIYSKWHYLSLSICRKLLFSATINSTCFFHLSNSTKENEES